MFHVEHSRLACLRNAGRVRPRPQGRVCPLPAFLKLPRSPGAGTPAPRLILRAVPARARRGRMPCGCLLPPCLLVACSLLARCLLAACVPCRAGGARPAGCPYRGGERGTVRALRFSSCLRAFFSLLKSEYYITIVI